jgi:hypothetical protein
VLRAVDRLRAGALLLAGAVVVHEGRVLAEGHGGLARNPHDAVPLFVATAVVVTAIALHRSTRAQAERALPSFRRLWLGGTLSLVAIHLLQETLEGGVHQALSPATVVAAACAVLVAVVLAVALREAERLIAARRTVRPGRLRAAAAILPRPPRLIGARPVPLARHLAGRAPPSAA